jgi:hypothetical protein
MAGAGGYVNPVDLIIKKARRAALSPAEIQLFVDGVAMTAGLITRSRDAEALFIRA